MSTERGAITSAGAEVLAMMTYNRDRKNVVRLGHIAPDARSMRFRLISEMNLSNLNCLLNKKQQYTYISEVALKHYVLPLLSLFNQKGLDISEYHVFGLL